MAINTYKKDAKTKLSENFNVHEFSCHGSGCCATVLIDEQLVKFLQKIRDHFGQPVTITSGYRCATHNKKVGGVTASNHVKGQAADIVITGVAPAEIAKYAESIGVLGIGLYETAKDGYFVHIDTRSTKSFWYGQSQAYRRTFGGSKIEASQKTCSLKLPVLSKGNQGTSVEALQILLKYHGYNCGTSGVKKDGVDGNFGVCTESALKNYQKDTKKSVDGKAGAQVWSGLLGI